MGGGKGAIDHYVTPVKAGRIIIELGGFCEYEEVQYLLKDVAMKLPFKADPVSLESMEAEEADKGFIEENNINPFNFKYCLSNNFLGSRLWASKYDYIWHGKHR